MSKTIPIFFTFDNNYVEPAAVAFYSLLEKAHSHVFYEMYVVHSGITEDRQKLLHDIIRKKGNAKLTFISNQGFLDQFWNNGSFQRQEAGSTFTVDTLVRCFGAGFFPQHDKIIYSDVDVVFADDISELYEIDLTGKYIAGVKGAFLKYSKYETSHLKPEHYKILHDKYLAGGIWVMNLAKIRQDSLEKKMISIINDNSIIKRWNDQDVINIACEGNVGFIPLNYISYPYMIDLLQKDDFVSDYTREELYDSIINPKIIHYAASKPWNASPNYSTIWWTYFHYLGLSKTKIFKDTNTAIHRKKLKKYRKVILILAIIVAVLLLYTIISLCYTTTQQ